MASRLTKAQISTIATALSTVRLATFDVAPGFSTAADSLEKYSWHALTSAAFLASLHICEVTTRNAVNEALITTYGANWPWNLTFERSLPNPRGNNFNPTKELQRARGKMSVGATDKVVAELKFAFWCHMFTSRYQVRIWDRSIRRAFPDLPTAYSAPQARQIIHLELDSLRKFRNRIAHHEPILSEPLPQRQNSIQSLMTWRCAEISFWHATWETVTSYMAAKP